MPLVYPDLLIDALTTFLKCKIAVMMWFLTQLSWQRTMKYDTAFFSNCIISTQLQFLWLEMQSKWSPFSLNIIDFVYIFFFYEYLCGMSQLHGVTIPKCLLCDVPESCKLHRLSKFHSLTKNHRYPQVMIHDVPPLATLLESLPVVKICDLDSPSHAFFGGPEI